MAQLKGEPMVKGKACSYCHMEFLNARPNSDSRFRSILRFRSGSSFRICLDLHLEYVSLYLELNLD